MTVDPVDPATGQDVARLGGYALATLHSAEITGVGEQAERLFADAATSFERLAGLGLPGMAVFLARSYRGAGRFATAMSVLDEHLREYPADRGALELRARLDATARSDLVRLVAGKLAQPDESAAQALVRANASLVDDQLARLLRNTLIHYADRADTSIFDRLQSLLRLLAEETDQSLYTVIASEGDGIAHMIHGRAAAALPLLRAAYDAYGVRDPEYRGSAASHLGMAEGDAGLLVDSEKHLREAVEYYESTGDAILAALMMENLAGVLIKADAFDRALRQAERARDLLAAHGDASASAKAAIVVARALEGLGRDREALETIETVVFEGRVVWADRPEILATGLITQSYMLEARGRLAEASLLQAEASRLIAASHTAQAMTLAPEISGIKGRLNAYPEAIKAELDALARNDANGQYLNAARNRVNVAALLTRRLILIPYAERTPAHTREVISDVAYAKELLDEAVATLTPLGSGRVLAQAQRQSALISMIMGDVAGACDALRACATTAQSANDTAAASMLQNLAALHLSSGDTQSARKAIVEATDLAGARLDPDLAYDLDRILAQVESLEGNKAQASVIYRRLLEKYDTRESFVGPQEFIVEWSRAQYHVFDEALNHFAGIGDAAGALEVALLAKNRSLQAVLAERRNAAPARSVNDISHSLTAETVAATDASCSPVTSEDAEA